MSTKTKIDEGGPAFPAMDWRAKGNHHPGMSLRDWLAGQALAGLLANPIYVELQEDFTQCAKAAYLVADAMIRTREVKP